MKLPTSNKTSSYNKPHIRKGYYPGQLLKVEPFVDKNGVLKEGKYGHQLIMEFVVFKGELDTGKPIEPMMFEEQPVKISKFVYYEYKDSKTGEFQTAITPNSAITKLLVSLGWTFSDEDVDIEGFVGNWVELNLDDYTPKGAEDGVKASTIANINKYEGPAVEGTEEVKASEPPQEVKKTLTHEDVKKDSSVDNSAEIKKIKDKIVELGTMNKDGLLTDDGFIQAKKQHEDKLKELE